MPFSPYRPFLRSGDPATVGYVLFWAHLWWALGVALSGHPALGLLVHFPLARVHLWDAMAVVVAVVLRLGLRRMDRGGDQRLLQVGAALSAVLWTWADVAFLATLGPSTGLIYTALAGAAAWLVYLTGDAWVTHA